MSSKTNERRRKQYAEDPEYRARTLAYSKAWYQAHKDEIRAEPNSLGFPGAPGALGVPLTAGRSLAVDSAVIPLGMPVFLSTTDPTTHAPLDRLTASKLRKKRRAFTLLYAVWMVRRRP